ncbi:hypothetical protein CLF_113009, partial [Clonorchis sinensis]
SKRYNQRKIWSNNRPFAGFRQRKKTDRGNLIGCNLIVRPYYSVIIIIDSITSVFNTDASLPYNHDLFESLIVKKRIKACVFLCGQLLRFHLRLIGRLSEFSRVCCSRFPPRIMTINTANVTSGIDIRAFNTSVLPQSELKQLPGYVKRFRISDISPWIARRDSNLDCGLLAAEGVRRFCQSNSYQTGLLFVALESVIHGPRKRELDLVHWCIVSMMLRDFPYVSISQPVRKAFVFIKKSSLAISLGVCACVLLVLLVIIAAMLLQRRRQPQSDTDRLAANGTKKQKTFRLCTCPSFALSSALECIAEVKNSASSTEECCIVFSFRSLFAVCFASFLQQMSFLSIQGVRSISPKPNRNIHHPLSDVQLSSSSASAVKISIAVRWWFKLPQFRSPMISGDRERSYVLRATARVHEHHSGRGWTMSDNGNQRRSNNDLATKYGSPTLTPPNSAPLVIVFVLDENSETGRINHCQT